MKNLKNIALIAALMLLGTFTACKKDKGPDPDGNKGSLTNSAQLFFDDNTSIKVDGNDQVSATYTNNELKISFKQGASSVSLDIPNYDLYANNNEYNNSNAGIALTTDSKSYNSAYIYVPVIVGYPPTPVFVTDKLIDVKINNLQVDASTTDISIEIVDGSQLITTPVSNGNGASYSTISFIQGSGGKPNMINVRIKK